MQKCLNCYNSFMCKLQEPKLFEKHKDEDITSCLKWEDDQASEEEE